MIGLKERLGFLYNSYVLAILTVCYTVGELGHYLIGVISKAAATDLHYGDVACQLINRSIDKIDLPLQCEKITNVQA